MHSGNRNPIRLGLAAALVVASCARLFAADAPGEHFDQKIAPLIAVRCLNCHNPTDKKGGLDLSTRTAALKGGELGSDIVPGNLEESLVWEKVRTGEMPPKKPLPPEERALIKTWIVGGAAWGTERIDPFRFTTAARAGYDWWALQPVVRPALPAVKDAANCENAIDLFVRAKLTEKGLAPSPPADRRTLIRRAYFDLIGLPPTPEATAAFVADPAPNAYERLVDELLASPEYGVRWARHWLDVARFGESNGFEYDQLRDNAWPYRDWVVNAFNADMPYHEFARQQLAGDVRAPRDPAAVAATGFLVAGAFDGLIPAGDIMKQVMRQDVLEDFVGTVSQTFLGLTAHCARCHDHKFDPISQREYYRLAATLAGVTHGEREVSPSGNAEQLAAEVAKVEAELKRIEQPAREKIRASRADGGGPKPVGPPPLARWDFSRGPRDEVGALHANTHGNAKLTGVALVLDGKDAYAVTAPLTQDIGEKTLAVWVRLNKLDQRGGGAMSIQTLDGGTFDSIVFGEREEKRWMAGSNGFARYSAFGGPEETEAKERFIHFAITYAADGTITAYRNGLRYGQSYVSSTPAKFAAGKAEIVFGLRHEPTGENKMLAGSIERAELYDRALTAEEVAAAAGAPSNYISAPEIAAALEPEQARAREALLSKATSLRESRSKIGSRKIYAVSPRAPEATFVLARGNALVKQDEVTPGGISSLAGVESEFGLKSGAGDGERREKLAAWIANASNPLFARVMMNRLWHYHFGAGLVTTPNDFGFNAGRPSHPELLDWLASELVQQNFSLKRMHYLIVTSSTYKQASAAGENAKAASAVDADNRLLWRKAPQRLDAESTRDAVLAVAGELNTAKGGPGYYDFNTYVSKSTRYYDPTDPEGANFQRRSLYRTWARGGRSPLLDTFDCPDPSTNTPNRAVTTTPLQALSLMNNSFVLRMSERFAGRVEREAGPEAPRQVARVYALALQRAPRPEEEKRLAEFISRHGLAALCRVIINSNEFIYVE